MDPEVWRWIWLVAAATFVVGEIAMTGANALDNGQTVRRFTGFVD